MGPEFLKTFSRQSLHDKAEMSRRCHALHCVKFWRSQIGARVLLEEKQILSFNFRYVATVFNNEMFADSNKAVIGSISTENRPFRNFSLIGKRTGELVGQFQKRKAD